jgi:hypothetical protein
MCPTENVIQLKSSKITWEASMGLRVNGANNKAKKTLSRALSTRKTSMEWKNEAKKLLLLVFIASLFFSAARTARIKLDFFGVWFIN